MHITQYTNIFIDESKENLQELNENLLKLEQNPESEEIINEIFRIAHTLKGMSQTMGYTNIGNLTNNMENLLDSIRNKEQKVNETLLDILFKSLDRLDAMVVGVAEGNKEEIPAEDLISEITNYSTSNNNQTVNSLKDNSYFLEENVKNILSEAKNQGLFAKNIQVNLSKECLMPAVRAYMVIQTLDNEVEIVKSMPHAEEIEKGEIEGTLFLSVITKLEENEISEKILNISDVDEVKIFDALEENQENKKQNKIISNISDKANEVVQKSKVATNTIRINADRIEMLMNLVGELVTNKTQLTQISEESEQTRLTGVSNNISNITGELQELVINLRMLPIENVFNRFPRLVRDISKKLDKEVNLVITGEKTEIDRGIVDEIGEPLVHLMKNSLDHGIEGHEERIKKDKPAKGTILLSASNEGENIVIKIKDDGKGINTEKLKQKALEKGIITREKAEKLTKKECLELIFEPGLSTNDEANDLSGRGVGMDVVKSSITTLGGNVIIDSEIDMGTSVTITLPSTMAITNALMIRASNETYAVPLNYISESVEINKKEVKRIQNKEVIILREETIPLVKLEDILGIENTVDDNTDLLNILVANIHSNQIGIVVSEVLNQQEIVMKPIDDFIGIDKIVAGATILGNGKIALILNVNELYEETKK